MSKNWLKNFGFLGFLGLLGYFSDIPGFYAFFGFLGFFSFAVIKHDERMQANLNRAGRNAFVSGIFLFVIVLLYTMVEHNVRVAGAAFFANFSLQFVVFYLSFHYYDRMR